MNAASHSVAVVAQLSLPERVGIIVLDRNSESSLSRARRLLHDADVTGAPAMGVACCPHGLTVVCAASGMHAVSGLLTDEKILSADVCPAFTNTDAIHPRGGVSPRLTFS